MINKNFYLNFSPKKNLCKIFADIFIFYAYFPEYIKKQKISRKSGPNRLVIKFQNNNLFPTIRGIFGRKVIKNNIKMKKY